MSTRGGNDGKKGQRYQNTFAFKHNKNSMLTRKIRDSPLDMLCKRCLEQLEWRINYRKYKPLTTAAKCIKCEGRTICKAYRTHCDICALASKICTKCACAVEQYAKPTNWKNDPSKKNKHKRDPFKEIVKELKERYKRTVERKIQEGEKLVFDRQKGIINSQTGEIVIDLEIVKSTGYVSSSEEEDNLEEEIEENDMEENDMEDCDHLDEERKDNLSSKDEEVEKITCKLTEVDIN